VSNKALGTKLCCSQTDKETNVNRPSILQIHITYTIREHHLN